MSGTIAARLVELGIVIPRAQPPRVARILGAVRVGNLLFVSGQIPQWEGELRYIGKVGREYTIEEGQAAARLSALNVLAQAQVALDGDLDRIRRIAKVAGYVNCEPDLTEIGAVINGASTLFLDIFGDRGQHARVAVGAMSMPLGVAVEIEAIMEVE